MVGVIMERFIIAHMYPDLMNLYGDQGNLTCLKKRLEWYGLNCAIKPVHLGQELDFSQLDMLFMGGGSDREQGLIYEDLIKRSGPFLEEIEKGLPVLCICGAYQLLGQYYYTSEGQSYEGLGFFNIYTQGGKQRLIGNIALEINLGGEKTVAVGFENHSGRTYFTDKTLHPFGRVLKGFGNNGEDGYEGLHYRNLIGTYLHGPLLPKNPVVADYFIKTMLKRRGLTLEKSLDDTIENLARQQVMDKIMSS